MLLLYYQMQYVHTRYSSTTSPHSLHAHHHPFCHHLSIYSYLSITIISLPSDNVQHVCMWASTLTTQERSWTPETKETYLSMHNDKVYQTPINLLCLLPSMFYLRYSMYVLSLLPPASHYDLLINHSFYLLSNPRPYPSSIATPSVWASVIPPPLLLLDSWRPLSKLEFESRHSLLEINGDLCSHRDDLEYRRSFTNPVLPIDVGPTIPPPHDTITIHSCQLGSMNLLPSTPRRPKLVAISIYYYCSACVWTFLWSLLVLIVVTAYLVPYMSHTYIHTKYSSSGVISYRHPVYISQTIILIILLLSVHLPAERNHKKTRRGPQRAVHAAISFQNFSSCGAHGARKKTKKSPIDSTEAWRHPIASWHPTHRSMASHITHARGRSPVIFTATTSTINTINTSRLSRSVGVYIIYYENSSVDAVEVIYLAHSATNWLPQEYTGEKKKRYQVLITGDHS